MMTPLVLCNPLRGGTRVLEVLNGMSATIAWSDHGALEESVDAILALSGNTLFVDTEVDGSAGASMAFQQQVMGVPSFVLLVVEDAADLASAAALARAALTSLPPSALLVIGDDETQSALADVAIELELVPPLATTLADLSRVAAELVATARWESVS